MRKTLKDFREADAFTVPGPRWDKFDRVFLGGLTTCAILAIAFFAYIATIFVH
jgi:hypothetical protein